jgi:Protein of unknown function (DUF2848)
MVSNFPNAPAVALTVVSLDGKSAEVRVTVAQAFNFGYAARDQAGLEEHLRDTANLGLAAPLTIPALYPIPPDRVTTAASLVVSGDDTYAEVEFALICDSEGRWLITVASDHTDAGVERGSVVRGKSIAPNVLAPTAWVLDEVESHLDHLCLSCRQSQAKPAEVVQSDSLATLLSPSSLIDVLTQRTGAIPGPGTVILSGTIGGELPVGCREWLVALEDPILHRRIEHRYTVHALPDELPQPASAPAIAGPAS